MICGYLVPCDLPALSDFKFATLSRGFPVRISYEYSQYVVVYSVHFFSIFVV